MTEKRIEVFDKERLLYSLIKEYFKDEKVLDIANKFDQAVKFSDYENKKKAKLLLVKYFRNNLEALNEAVSVFSVKYLIDSNISLNDKLLEKGFDTKAFVDVLKTERYKTLLEEVTDSIEKNTSINDKNIESILNTLNEKCSQR